MDQMSTSVVRSAATSLWLNAWVQAILDDFQKRAAQLASQLGCVAFSGNACDVIGDGGGSGGSQGSAAGQADEASAAGSQQGSLSRAVLSAAAAEHASPSHAAVSSQQTGPHTEADTWPEDALEMLEGTALMAQTAAVQPTDVERAHSGNGLRTDSGISAAQGAGRSHSAHAQDGATNMLSNLEQSLGAEMQHGVSAAEGAPVSRAMQWQDHRSLPVPLASGAAAPVKDGMQRQDHGCMTVPMVSLCSRLPPPRPVKRARHCVLQTWLHSDEPAAHGQAGVILEPALAYTAGASDCQSTDPLHPWTQAAQCELPQLRVSAQALAEAVQPHSQPGCTDDVLVSAAAVSAVDTLTERLEGLSCLVTGQDRNEHEASQGSPSATVNTALEGAARFVAWAGASSP